MIFHSILEKLTHKQNLSVAETQSAFDAIFENQASADQIAAFLTALHTKGETVDEILGAAISMRGKAITVKAPSGTIDIVGTGGDGHATLNISTAVALVVAACGVTVAKHGNRAASSHSGSSDVLAALGINLDADVAVLEECLAKANICFMFAPKHHPAMKYVAEVRRQLKCRTIFNLLGPLTNPANVRRHLIGVYALEWLGPMAEVLKTLGSDVAWLAHGHDGMDEITTTSPTDVVELNRGMIRHFTLEPEQLALPRVPLNRLRGGDAAHNAGELKKLLRGERNPYRDIVLLNASAALIVASKVNDLKQGMHLAAMALDGGGAQHTLDRLIKVSNHQAI